MSYPCLELRLPEAIADAASGLLLAWGSSGIERRDDSTLVPSAEGTILLLAWFTESTTAETAASALEQWAGALEPSAPVEVSLSHVDDPGWRTEWRRYFHPMRFGHRLWVAPPDEDPPEGELVAAGVQPAIVRLLPSVAFGTGTHESTAMVLELLDERITPGARVLDVGCGSGILAMAAVKLGAERALGVDVDPEAVAAARENALNNGVAHRCHFDGTPLEELAGRYDLVLANIQTPTLNALGPALVERVDVEGLLIWSGILETDLPELRPPPGCALECDRRRGEWVAQAYRRLPTESSSGR